MSLGLDIDVGGIYPVGTRLDGFADALDQCRTSGEVWQIECGLTRSLQYRQRLRRISAGRVTFYRDAYAMCEARRLELQAAEAAQASGGATDASGKGSEQWDWV